MSDFDAPAAQGSREPAVRVWLILWKAAHAIEKNAMQSVSALGLGLSALCFVAIQYTTGASWSVAVRRVAEALAVVPGIDCRCC